MEDWKIRLVNEQIELKERIKKLTKFLDGLAWMVHNGNAERYFSYEDTTPNYPNLWRA